MEETEAVKHIVKVKDMMETGLLLLYTKDRIDRVKKRSTNIDRFRKQFGINPITACNLYEDMQLADLETEWVPGPTSLRFFLMGLYLLRKYPTYDDIESTFDYAPGYASRLAWEWVKRFREMLPKVCVFPTADEWEDQIWCMTVDGTHVWRREPKHPEKAIDRSVYSHKYNKAGFSYELAISLNGGLVWVHGPFPAGQNDITIFRKGLKARLLLLGRKAVGDRGYRGEPTIVSYPNATDSPAVALFKSRALNRHENFNGMTKTFDSLSG
ncbi:MAG: hypothetical protein SGARI_003765, partial [Bacillariaceae sp.]